MNVAVFSTKPHDRVHLDEANAAGEHQLLYFEPHLDEHTVPLAEGCDAVCIFVNDTADRGVIQKLASLGVKVIALRCAGYNNVDLEATREFGLEVVRVPGYSPYAVAEHAVALILALNRHIPRALSRVRDGNFELRGLEGFDLHGKTVGVIGTGRIGLVFCRIMMGFGCRVMAFDPFPNPECEKMGVEIVPLPELLKDCDVISLHCPLTPDTQHLINPDTISQMKPEVMLINTSRGGLVDTRAVIAGLKDGRIGWLGLDVYEEEGDFFFEDLSDRIIHDDVLMRLTTFPNVIITGHQAFFTREALDNIAGTTLSNLSALAKGEESPNLVKQ